MEPYIGEIRCFSFGRIPVGWLACQGQILPLQQYAALYSLLGTAYGGNGQTNFGLPDLRGVVPIHYNPTGNAPNPQTNVGATGGVETVTLSLAQMPSHTHQVNVNKDPATVENPTNNYSAALVSPHLAYAAATSPTVAMAPDFIGAAGGGGSHANMQPYLVVNYCIATTGYYPQRP